MYEVFERLLKERGLTAYKVSKDTGIAQSVLSAWKNGVSQLKQDKFVILADYFGVSIDYLMTGKDIEKESDSGKKYYFSDETAEKAQELFENPEMRVLFDAARGASPEDLQMVTGFLLRLKGTNVDG